MKAAGAQCRNAPGAARRNEVALACATKISVELLDSSQQMLIEPAFICMDHQDGSMRHLVWVWRRSTLNKFCGAFWRCHDGRRQGRREYNGLARPGKRLRKITSRGQSGEVELEHPRRLRRVPPGADGVSAACGAGGMHWQVSDEDLVCAPRRVMAPCGAAADYGGAEPGELLWNRLGGDLAGPARGSAHQQSCEHCGSRHWVTRYSGRGERGGLGERVCARPIAASWPRIRLRNWIVLIGGRPCSLCHDDCREHTGSERGEADGSESCSLFSIQKIHESMERSCALYENGHPGSWGGGIMRLLN